jgi:phenylalanyl-tRNA synthetase beta chain
MTAVLALGGIVGGVPTSCTIETVNVFVEAAYFNPVRISRTGRDMQIDSDARYRFERGVDPEFTVTGMEIATRLNSRNLRRACERSCHRRRDAEMAAHIDYDPSWFQSYIGADVAARCAEKNP